MATPPKNETNGNSTPAGGNQKPAGAPITKPPSSELITNQFSAKSIEQRTQKNG
jgi:hypothetical protein